MYTRRNTTYRDTAACVTTLVVLIGYTFTGPALAATYHVSRGGSDANPGTNTSPWRTIRKAVHTMVGGDTAIVNAGKYNEIVDTVRSGTAAKRITIRASGNVVTKTFNIWHDYVTVDGFEMTAANQPHMMTINGSYCEIMNNRIHDTGASFGVIRMDGKPNTGCLIRGNHFYSSTGPGNDLPLIIVSGTNHVVEGNEVGPAKDLDVFRVWGEGHVIRGNYIHDVTLSPGSIAHMDVFQTFGVPGQRNVVARNILFEKNKVVHFDGQICMTSHTGSAEGMRDWDIRNNVFVNIPVQANIGIPNMRFHNNTFYNVGSSNRLVLYAYDALPQGDSTGVQVLNNIIITASNLTKYSEAISISASGARVDYNYVANVDGQPLNGFSEAHGINGGDPRFVDADMNAFDLHPLSPAINRAMPMTTFQDDFAGTPRPQGHAWDMGAFEHKGIGRWSH